MGCFDGLCLFPRFLISRENARKIDNKPRNAPACPPSVPNDVPASRDDDRRSPAAVRRFRRR